MSVTATPAFRLLNEHRFADLVQSVDCSDSKTLKVNFKSASYAADAKKAWSWVDESDANSLIYVADAPGCGGETGRQPYEVASVSYDEAAGVASMAVRAAAEWEDFVEDATVNIGGEAETRELAGRASYTKKIKIPIAKTFNTHFYDADIGPAHLSVSCSDCGTHGSLDTDITVSTKHGFSASALTTDGVNVRLAVAITASAAITTSHLSQNINVLKYPLAEFKIAKVVTITPEIALDIVISVTDIKGAITTVVGAELDFADGQPISIGKGSTGLDATFKRIGPTVSGKVDATARINPLLRFDLAGKILSKHVTGGLGIAAPYLAITMGADVNAPNTCGGGTSSLHYGLDVGVEVDTFYGFGKPTDQPNKHAIYQKDHPLLKDCIAITH